MWCYDRFGLLGMLGKVVRLNMKNYVLTRKIANVYKQMVINSLVYSFLRVKHVSILDFVTPNEENDKYCGCDAKWDTTWGKRIKYYLYLKNHVCL